MRIICFIIGHKWLDLGSYFYTEGFMYNQKTCLRCGKTKSKKLYPIYVGGRINSNESVRWISYYFGD